MKQFEYKVLLLKNKFSFKTSDKVSYFENQINELGIQGWELVEVPSLGNIAIFKREIL